MTSTTDNASVPSTVAAAVPRRARTGLAIVSLALLVLFVLPVAASGLLYLARKQPQITDDNAWASAAILPPAADDRRARIVLFAVPIGRWRTMFAMHTWIVVKPENGPYTRYDVIHVGAPLRINAFPPDGKWAGHKPVLVASISGPVAAQAIPKIEAAVKSYAYRNEGDYRLWPGPNSNTFIATVLRAIPEAGLVMPPNAMGRDFRPALYGGASDSGTGVELNLWGLLGLKLGWVEGVEINLLSLVAGFDLREPALKFPGLGRVGLNGRTPAAAAAEREQ